MRMPPSGRKRTGRLLGVLAVLLAVLTALVGPVGSAYAAVGAATKPTAASTATTAPVPTSKVAKPKPAIKPAPPAKQKLPSASAADTARLRATAAKSAIAHSDVPDTCSGAIAADTVYPCTTPSDTGTDTFTLTLPQATDVLLLQAMSSSFGSNTLQTAVTGPDGDPVACQQPNWAMAVQCPTTQAGTYTVQVQNGDAAYTLAYSALLSDAHCAVADPSFAAPTLQGSLAAGAVGDCYTLALASGSVIHVALSATPYQQLMVTVFDATGAQVCIDDQGDCTLTGTGPYRILASGDYGTATSYFLQVNGITQPQGCVTTAQAVYGTPPDATSTVRCRILNVTTAGQYQVHAVSSIDGNIGGTLYDTDGTPACTNSGPDCQLAVGSYDFVADAYPPDDSRIAVLFMAADESRGCTATGDTDFASGAATGAFGGLAEELCLNLPTAAGLTDYMFDQPTADGSVPQMQVVDATGAQQCSDADFDYATCALTGTAPFRVILSARGADTGYRVLVQRTDSSAGCADWPQSGFGGSWGATVSVTPSSTVGCLSIPAKQHSTGEMIDYANDANAVDGAIYVNDPSGKSVCVGASTSVCAYTAGVAYTALVIDAYGTSDTYHVVRRDVSKTAPCSTPASTKVGGPSTGFVLTSDLDTQCVRVAAAAADKLHFAVRTSAPSPAGAVLQVTDPNGKIVCRQSGVACQLTGSTSYQLIVTASGYSGIAIPAHVDTWRVGTASGWAPECQAHQLSVNGFGPLSGKLTETATGYCAVVAMQPSQQFGVFGTATASGVNVPWVSMFDSANWTNGLGFCYGTNYGSFGSTCSTQSNDQAAQAVLMVSPDTDPTPLSYTMQGVCRQGCTTQPAVPTLTSVAPATGAADSANQAVVHGTGLTLGTDLQLVSDGSRASANPTVYPQSVSADGKSLTVLVEPYGVAPGSYDLELTNYGSAQGSLPYKVTAAPSAQPGSRFAPVTPSRILDTRSGLGAAKARVAAHGVVKLKVQGLAGVPASGVTAVAMNVTAVNPAASGYVTAYPDGRSRPTVSNLNFVAKQTIPNLVIVPVVDGKVDLYNGSSGAVDLLADVTGYYTTGSGGSVLTAVGPSRILDTRSGLGAAKARVAAHGVVKLKVQGLAGVPASGVTAVAMNVTAVNPAASGYVTAYPDGQSRPTVSNLNFVAKQTIPNLVIVRVVNGKVDLYNGSSGAVDLLADVTGYYSADGSVFQADGPLRAMDTRSGLGGAGTTVAAHAAATLPVMGLPGIPGTVTSVLLNVTVTAPQKAGFLTVFPEGQSLPGVSNLNFSANETIANLVVVPVIDGQIVFYNGSGGSVQVIADLDGYYTS